MTEVALGSKQNEIAQVSERRTRAVDEVREACMAWSDEAPKQTCDNQHTDNIPGPDMHREQVILGEIGNCKGSDQRPVEDPHKSVPNADLDWRLRGSIWCCA